MSGKPYDPAGEGAQMSFDGRMSYSDYLHLERVLEAQEPLSAAHDELLFIIQHQTSELWMKLAIHEIRSAIRAIHEDRLQPAFKMLSRVARIFEQLTGAWDVLRTMTPSEYTEFRDSLGQSSGFQSWQYRAIEFLAGNRNLAMLRPHAHRAATEPANHAVAERTVEVELQLFRLRSKRDVDRVRPEHERLAFGDERDVRLVTRAHAQQEGGLEPGEPGAHDDDLRSRTHEANFAREHGCVIGARVQSGSGIARICTTTQLLSCAIVQTW